MPEIYIMSYVFWRTVSRIDSPGKAAREQAGLWGGGKGGGGGGKNQLFRKDFE